MAVRWFFQTYTPNAARTHAKHFDCDTAAEMPALNMIEGDTAFVLENTTAYTWTAGAWVPDTVYDWGGSGTTVTYDWQTPVALPNDSYYLAYGDGVLVATNNNTDVSAFASADHGATWTDYAMPSGAGQHWYPIYFGGGRFLAPNESSAGSVAVSTDGGQTWTEHSALGAGNTWTRAGYGGGKWVLLAYGTDDAAYSADGGATWTAATLPASGQWQDVAHNALTDTFIAVRNGSTDAAKSTDGGATWSSVAMSSVRSWSSIACNGSGVWMALAANFGGPSAVIATSDDDGATWAEVAAPLDTDDYSNLAFLVDHWYVASDETLLVSGDNGVTWTSYDMPSYEWNGIAFAGSTLVAVSSDGFATRSVPSQGIDLPLILDSGSITTNEPALQIFQTWDSPDAFAGLLIGITETESGVSNLRNPIQVDINGETLFSVRNNGSIKTLGGFLSYVVNEHHPVFDGLHDWNDAAYNFVAYQFLVNNFAYDANSLIAYFGGLANSLTIDADCNLATDGYLQLNEQTAPAAPAANKVRIYAEDNGSGKTRIMARFATGAAVQIAIEP